MAADIPSGDRPPPTVDELCAMLPEMAGMIREMHAEFRALLEMFGPQLDRYRQSAGGRVGLLRGGRGQHRGPKGGL